jgi:hypothetical protein
MWYDLAVLLYLLLRDELYPNHTSVTLQSDQKVNDHTTYFRYWTTPHFEKHITLPERFQVILSYTHWAAYKNVRFLTVTFNLILPMGHNFLAHKPTMVLPKQTCHSFFKSFEKVFFFSLLVYYNKYHALVFSLPLHRLRIKLMEYFNKSVHWPPTNWWSVAMKSPGH